MKARFAILSLVSLLLVSSLASASETLFSAMEISEADAPAELQDFLIEGNFVVNSAEAGSNVMFGPSLAWGPTSRDWIGFSPLISMGEASHYMATVFYRRYFSEKKSRLYFQPGASLNLVNFPDNYFSGTFLLGFVHNLTSDFTIGGQAGFDGFEKNNGGANGLYVGSLILSPRTSLTIGVSF